ncbi:hypothetical protein B0A55_05229 [Friedmanniomyces simplex]|uniref:Uncharacterized protein n=1 Tax=Friedmanniomyces simplex TaxID=329884 RepID=A0A4U0XET8_9PEZI|nr:hypothetical protein B0A55_05229 [Friedmanniomyces simplex]
MDSEQQQQKEMMSGESTPDYPQTPKAASSIDRLHRSDSQETLRTSITEVESVESVESFESTPSRDYPAPPLNSPMTMSEVGDRELPNADSLADKLQAMPNNFADVTPPTSIRDDKGKTLLYHGVEVKDFGHWHDPPRALRYRVKMLTAKRVERVERIPRWERDSTPTPAKARGTKTPPTKDLFPEHSNWANVAEEDVMVGLKRLTMLARDEHKVDPTKTIEQIYSERLAKLIRESELQFDLGVLQ